MIIAERLKGTAYQDTKTKRLVERLPTKSIAVVVHQDLDETAAEMLIRCKIKAVINFQASMSGLFVHNGVEILLKANIPVYDIQQRFNSCDLEGNHILIENNWLFREIGGTWQQYASLKKYSLQEVNRLKMMATSHFSSQFKAFVGNSVYYSEKELLAFLEESKKLPTLRRFINRDVLIVARGSQYEKDLKVMKSFIVKKRFLIIAVDGGADGLLNQGLTPDFIIGDMDSVSEKALKSGAEILVHTYRNGNSPGESRLKSLHIPYKKICLVGTSEDVALVFSYCSGARRLYSIGTRIGMNEFLEKGRVGMGSSLLTRMKVGHALVDLKGIHTVINKGEPLTDHTFVLFPAFIALIMLSFNPKFTLLFSLIFHWWSGR